MEAQDSPTVDISGQMPTERPALPPRCAQAYELMRHLGGGAYGEVWLAKNRFNGERVALKVPRAGTPVEPDIMRRFLNEARVTAQLDHQGIVRVRAHGLENGVPWIAYEYLGDLTVQRRLNREGELAPEVVLQIGAQVAAGLEAAHARGVIHRDLKPANIIETCPGHFKVLDFGLAYGRRPYQMQTGSHIIVGTPAYLAPEQIQGANASELTDQFGLGLVLYQLLTGVIPQHEDSVPTLLRRRSREPIGSVAAERAGLPEKLIAIVDRMLNLDPRARFASLKEARRAMDAALAEIGLESRLRIPRMSGRTALRTTPPAARVRPVHLRRAPLSAAAAAPAAARVRALRAGSLSYMLIAPLLAIASALAVYFRN